MLCLNGNHFESDDRLLLAEHVTAALVQLQYFDVSNAGYRQATMMSDNRKDNGPRGKEERPTNTAKPTIRLGHDAVTRFVLQFLAKQM